MKKIFLALLVSLGFGTAFANENQIFVCKNGSAQDRTVEIVSLSDTGAPCDVIYNNKTLWHADHEAGYCKKKGLAFVEKLKGDGWNCSEEVSAKPAESTETVTPAQ